MQLLTEYNKELVFFCLLCLFSREGVTYEVPVHEYLSREAYTESILQSRSFLTMLGVVSPSEGIGVSLVPSELFWSGIDTADSVDSY